MKAIVLHQPYATLVAIGVKTIETRPSPLNGPMRPAGVRGLPGLSVERGERIAIVAGAKAPKEDQRVGAWTCREFSDGTWGMHDDHMQLVYARLPLGAAVCTAVVWDAAEMVGPDTAAAYPCIEMEGDGLSLMEGTDYWGEMQEGDISPQLPYGDFDLGRWGLLLTDVEPCAAVPVKGKQGVFALPDDVASSLNREERIA